MTRIPDSAARHPLENRPRERLLRRGALVLSDAELLAVLLGDDARTSTLVEALTVLDSCGGLAGLLSASQAPSSEGLVFTRRLAAAGKLVGVKLADHIILGGAGRWVSLQRRRAW